MEIDDLLRAIQQGTSTQDQSSQGIAAGFAGPQGTELSADGSATQSGAGSAGAGDPLSAILGALLGGAGAQRPTGGGGHMPGQGGEDPLGAILGAGQPQQPTPGPSNLPAQGGADPLGGILGGILGGGQPPQPGRSNMPAQSSDPLGGILGAVLGGGGVNPANNSLLSPIADFLAQKFGIPPALALVVVNFAATKLIAAQASGGAHGNFQVNQLMSQLNSPAGVSGDFAVDSGMAQELAAGTGMETGAAAQMLQAAYNQLGMQTATTLGLPSPSTPSAAPSEMPSAGTGEKRGGKRGGRRHSKRT